MILMQSQFSEVLSLPSLKQAMTDAQKITLCMLFTWEEETKLICSCYLYGQLKLLMLSLELLSLREGACIDEACIQH